MWTVKTRSCIDVSQESGIERKGKEELENTKQDKPGQTAEDFDQHHNLRRKALRQG